MTKIPMLIVDKLEIRERKFFFDKGCKIIKYRFCPMAYKNNELINVPCHTASGHLCIVPFKLGVLMLSLCFEIFFHPHLPMQMGIVDERKTFISCFFNHLRCYFLLTDTKERFVLRVIPKNTDAWHLFVEGLHVGHLFLMIFVCKLSHNTSDYSSDVGLVPDFCLAAGGIYRELADFQLEVALFERPAAVGSYKGQFLGG